ncbi:hypothetical protein CEE96_11795 [Lactobacillus crispatus]|nr:hypothetical protein CEE96_11795 [Lactobacillus crispatus]
MPALVAGIHDFLNGTSARKTWIPGPRPGMTAEGVETLQFSAPVGLNPANRFDKKPQANRTNMSAKIGFLSALSAELHRPAAVVGVEPTTSSFGGITELQGLVR